MVEPSLSYLQKNQSKFKAASQSQVTSIKFLNLPHKIAPVFQRYILIWFNQVFRICKMIKAISKKEFFFPEFKLD